ncbi:MAG: hypothetical protein M1830_010422 [Pleopsidium flavum]|nr:MAG: hypothetical protein M1830_010422 [Pleopsidium flavum]
MEKYTDRHKRPKPMNVEQIVKAAHFDYNPFVPLRYWLRTARTLLKESSIYEREGNDQQAYLLLFRHAQLVLGHLSTHPDAQQPENRLGLLEAEKEVNKSLAKLEVLKPRINKRYERYVQLVRDRNARAAALGRGDDRLQHNGPSDPAINGTTRQLAAGDNRDLAVKLAHKEIQRRATARRTPRQASASEDEEQERRIAGMWADWEEMLARDSQSNLDNDLNRQMQDIRLQIDDKKDKTLWNGRKPITGRDDTFNYPTVPEKSAYETYSPSPIPLSADKQSRAKEILKPPKVPKVPRKEHLGYENGSILCNQELPELPAKPPVSPYDFDTNSTAARPPQAELQPSTFTFKPSAYLENGQPLRTIFLSPDLRLQFLSIASTNTRANLETCGILCGTLISNALFISKLVIPDQESTSDTCDTINESDLFDYCDAEDLMVLGWIHTHPTQTCFMSSRDLHTHCGYQVMMPESIAIVCAPSKGEWGVFRLTDPPGMKSVLNCHQTGLFHPHAESNIYTDALRPGHVFEAQGLEFEVVDLRPGH